MRRHSGRAFFITAIIVGMVVGLGLLAFAENRQPTTPSPPYVVLSYDVSAVVCNATLEPGKQSVAMHWNGADWWGVNTQAEQIVYVPSAPHAYVYGAAGSDDLLPVTGFCPVG